MSPIEDVPDEAPTIHFHSKPIHYSGVSNSSKPQRQHCSLQSIDSGAVEPKSSKSSQSVVISNHKINNGYRTGERSVLKEDSSVGNCCSLVINNHNKLTVSNTYNNSSK